MIDKRVPSLAGAVAGIADGSTVLIGGFGDSGMPYALMDALLEQGATGLTIVSNNAGSGRGKGVPALFEAGRVRKIVCSFPRSEGSVVFEELYEAGAIELELVPQGTLSERIRAGAAGLGGFYTPTGAGTQLAAGKEERDIDGRTYVLERPIIADVSLVAGARADRMGNVVYHSAARNFGPVMAACGRLSIVQVYEMVEVGDIDPEHVMTPGIFVDRVVQVPR
ncbi:MAG: 3-oxoacid CoA-transferase subunit A [Candidatus Velthaea sp.]